MPFFRRRDRPTQPEPARRHTRAAGVALLVLLVLAAATGFLKHTAERGIRSQHELIALTGDLHAQEAMEWRVISGRIDRAESMAWLNNARENTVSRIVGVDAPGAGEADVDALLERYQAYARAVDGELDLVVRGRQTEAETFDEQYVDPAFDQALNRLSDLSASVAMAVDRARLLADLALAATFAAAATMIALLGSGRRLSRALDESRVRSLARYRVISAESTTLVAVLRRDGQTTFLSPAAERMLECVPTRDRLAAGSDAVLSRVHPFDRNLLLTQLVTVKPDSGPLQTELRLRAAGEDSGESDDEGVWRTYEMSFRDHTAVPGVEGVLLTGHDVTRQKELQDEIQRRTLHDDLTGLPNRALMVDRIQQALRDGGRHGIRVGLLIIDLDRFKEINDTLGHHYGDELLILVGQALERALRGVDTVARLGGDEFAVLLPQVSDLNGACAVAWKLHDALEEPFLVEGVELDVEASIGVAVSDVVSELSPAGTGDPGVLAASLLQRADVAMYVAKGRSTGVAGYDARDDVNTIERLALLGDLRRALHNDELYLVYQPKISLKDGALGSVEALLRWQHPERGLVPPDAFIPLAENTGLIGPLTRHVLDMALTQARVWMDAGRPMRIAVNTSARNLHDEEFDRTVRSLLVQHDVDASLLILEVTESALMADPVRAKNLLQRLAGQGIAISIDDFGAGYTSIKQLRSLPISELKVDRSFVQAMEQDEGEELIVRSVIELGRNLGLTTVAEGVETPEALVKLASFGCDTVQGYVLARPMTAEALDRWRLEWRGLELAEVIPSAP